MNGGITSVAQARGFLDRGLDGVMIGRAAYHTPAILADVDSMIFGGAAGREAVEVVERMIPYIEAHLAAGGRLHQITRHMLGLFHGMPGARGWRRVLSEGAHRDGVGIGLLQEAVAQVTGARDAFEAPTVLPKVARC